SAQLESNIRAFFDEFITRPEFVAMYGGLSNEDYVFFLLANGGISTSTGRLMITRLDGAQVVPPNGTSATGVAISRISFTNLDTVDFSLTLKNLSSAQTAAHLHGPAVAGANAPALVTLPNGDFRDFTVTFTAQQGIDMRTGRLYLDVHTQNNPDGEIRGQISALRFQRDVLVEGLNAGLINRAEALRLIVEDGDFRHDQFNRAFVLMEYFGYLRRNPDDPPDNNLAGYNFWLNKLNQFNGNFVSADMVKAFIKSTEYRRRFGPP
ncbi:MAG TPA: CHRD domain-containing protein, partial [Pyrinomonadaceae bacterium]|nr:CHRD domain-containing protein [Pyrinomonadaceae bacterium]